MLSERSDEEGPLSSASDIILEYVVESDSPQDHPYQAMDAAVRTSMGADVLPPAAEPDSHQYDWDMVMVFPRRQGGEEKHVDRYSCEKFVDLMLGLRKRGLFDHRGHKDDIVQDPLRVVFRTPRCFLTDDGDATISGLAVPRSRLTEHAREALETEYLDNCKHALAVEYERYIGYSTPTSQLQFDELVATSVARRLQVACGLTTRLFRSFDDDEIIVTIRADDMDLRIEADRMDYPMQTRNKPFSASHAERNKLIKAQIGDAAFEESQEFLRTVRGSTADEDGGLPELDPLLVSHGEVHHRKLAAALTTWGHREEADGPNHGRKSDANRKLSLWRRIINAYVYISWDHQTYFSPYAAYQIEDKFQPYYRWYPLTCHSTKEETLFRQTDRIVLATQIVNRHIGVDALMQKHLLKEHFALHDQEELRDLRKNWALNFALKSQPIQRLRNYFGDKVALYFAWLEFYAKMLIWPSVVGIVIFILNEVQDQQVEKASERQNGYYLIFFSGFVIIWSTLFTELWKRKNALYNTLWGSTADAPSHARPQFVGNVRDNPVTDQKEIWHRSIGKRRRKILSSLIVVAFMILIVLVALVGLFVFKFYLTESRKDAKGNGIARIEYASELVSVMNAIQIIVLNMIYRGIAIKLNDWENHRTDVDYENYLIAKVFLFQFCNSFASFFYIAFIKKAIEGQCVNENCFKEVATQLGILFVIRIVVGNTTEIAIPFITYKIRLWGETRKRDEGADKPIYDQAEKEAKLNPYAELEAFEDYNELVIQYGFVTLFVVAFPLAPLMALINNYLEVHVDAFKLCVGHRRPFPRQSKSIGSWFFFLRVMSNIAILTNSALLLFTSDLFEGSSDTTKLLIFILAEHLFLSLKFGVEHLVRDIPEQLVHLNERYVHIEAMAFKGLYAEEQDNLCEISEKVNVLIEPNPNWNKDKQV